MLEPGTQLAKFLNEPPFNGGNSIQGTFSFTSSVPVSAVALRGFINERSEFLITTLPIANLSSAPATDVTYIPHFADGGGWKTQVVLVNPTATAVSGSVQFFSQGSVSAPGAALSLNVNGTVGKFPYIIPAKSSVKLLTSGTSAGTDSGSVRITPAQGGVSPSSLVIFTFKPTTVTVAEAGGPVCGRTPHGCTWKSQVMAPRLVRFKQDSP